MRTPQPPKPLQAVIFDLDGTLIDTADEFIAAVQQLRAEHGKVPMDPERIRASVSSGVRALAGLALGIEVTAPELEPDRLRLLELYAELVGTLARPYPGLVDLINRLGDEGIAWGIATNKPRVYTETLLASLQDLPTPGSVVCRDDVSTPKPDPESLYRSCQLLACSPRQAIYVGDHQRDIEAGRRSGMYTIGAAYGYIEPGDEPGRWGADTLAYNSETLAQLIPI
ncbi:MAG: HAD-IA family hydrolase [Pseudomonadota bacterium]